MIKMETRKESLSALKVCRFCLTQNEPLSSLYEKSKAPKTSVTLSTKIMTCVSIEVFPSDKMPQYICNQCNFFMDLSYGFKQICRQADQNILHYIQNGTTIEPLTWSSKLNKVFKAHTKSELGLVKSVTQDGSTVKVTAEEVSDSEEGDDDNVYSVKIADGSEELKSIKVITSVNDQDTKDNRKAINPDADCEEGDSVAPPLIVQEGCWPCDQCECTYALKQLLTLHKAQKHRPKNMECVECDSKFFTKHDLMAHQLVHCTESPFKCIACNVKFKRLPLLKRHEKLIHSDMPQLKCEKCPATFLSQIQLEAHGVKHSPNAPRRSRSKIPDKRLVESDELHMDSLDYKKPVFDCNYCPERFLNVSKLGKHLRTHVGERAYPCKHCDKSFLKSHHYTRHLRVKHSETVRTPSGSYTEADAYRCEECEDSFPTQDELIYHSALHATRSLTCPLCQEKFDDVDTVTAHIKSHVNGAEFMCDFCELIFTTQQKLDTHIAISHDNELNDKDATENEEEEEDSMDTEGFEDEHTFNVKEEDGHMVVEIKKAGEYMLPDTVAMECDENNEIDQSEGSELAITLNDATGPLLASKPMRTADQQTPKRAKFDSLTFSKNNPGVSITRLKLVKANVDTSMPMVTNASVKPAVSTDESASMVKKTDNIKRKPVQQQSSPVPSIADKKEKTNAKVENSSAAGASDKSLRLLEKELQDLKRTNSRNDVAKTPAKPVEVLKNKKALIHTSTPKPRPADKKDVPTPKFALEKTPQEKRPPGRPPKENKEVKNTKEEREIVDKANVSAREDKETKEVTEKDSPQVKNGANERSSVEEPVRRSTRPSKVKDYAKMIRDSPDEDEESSEGLEEEDSKDSDKSIETPRRGRKPLAKPSPTVTPGSAVRKRGRPRKGQPAVPPKVSKKDESEDEEESGVSVPKVADNSKTNEGNTKPAENTKTETKTQVTDPVPDVIVSPCGQTLKKVPIKSLPPGIKPMPLPRKMTSGAVCEMQIGKKVVKVQKIVMTKAEVEAMTKQGLVEMKDGTIVLKQGIKLPGGTASLKSQLAAEEQKKDIAKTAKPTRCDFGGD